MKTLNISTKGLFGVKRKFTLKADNIENLISQAGQEVLWSGFKILKEAEGDKPAEFSLLWQYTPKAGELVELE